MTEGIIQKVFKAYINRSRRFNDDAYYGEIYEKQAEEYEHLQQELMEEIKKKTISARLGSYFYLDCISLKELIGDNE